MLTVSQAANELSDNQDKLQGEQENLQPFTPNLSEAKKNQKRGLLGLGYGGGQSSFGGYYGGFGGSFGYPYYNGFGVPRFPYYSGFGLSPYNRGFFY